MALCFVYFLIRGRANKKTANPPKIAIMQMAKLGDMICTTPMFRAVKEKYPQAEVLVIGNKINKEILEGNPDVDKYFIWERNFWRLVKALKKEKVDFACCTHPNFWGLALFYLAGAPLIAAPVIENGYSPVETRLYKILRKLIVAIPHRMGNYAPREYLKLLEPAGIFSENTKKYLYYSKQAEGKVKNFLNSKKINPKEDFVIGIAPSVGNKIRKWGGKNFAKVADYLHEKYKAKIFIVGSKNDSEDIQEMISNVGKETKVINTYNLFNLDELKAFISKLNLFISVETGPVFIAEAFNVPVVNLVGPVDDSAQSPRGDKNLIVKADREKPAIHVMNPRMCDAREARLQIENITLKMVTNKIDNIMLLIYN